MESGGRAGDLSGLGLRIKENKDREGWEGRGLWEDRLNTSKF